jgi:hypothetical protein
MIGNFSGACSDMYARRENDDKGRSAAVRTVRTPSQKTEKERARKWRYIS